MRDWWKRLWSIDVNYGTARRSMDERAEQFRQRTGLSVEEIVRLNEEAVWRVSHY